MNACGVYEIINLVNNHRYIGSSRNILERWKQHRTQLKKDKHPNHHLQRAWNLYGADNFKFIYLLQCDPHRRIEQEQEWIDECHPEYNTFPFARAGKGNKGRKRPDKAEWNKSHITKGHTGYVHSEETRAKMSMAWVERKKRGAFSAETRAKISAGNKGKVIPPEVRAKISATLMGHSMSPERIEKSAAKQRGRKLDPEFVKRRSAIQNAIREKKKKET